MSTSQASLEVAALLGIALLVLSLVGGIYVRERNLTLEEGLILEAKTAISLASSSLNQAYLAGDGFSLNFTLPEKIISFNYSISPGAGRLYLLIPERNVSIAEKILASGISGNLSNGKNTVRNIGGALFVA